MGFNSAFKGLTAH